MALAGKLPEPRGFLLPSTAGVFQRIEPADRPRLQQDDLPVGQAPFDIGGDAEVPLDLLAEVTHLAHLLLVQGRLPSGPMADSSN